MAVSEASVLWAKDPSIADSDDWPVYSLREVNVFSEFTGETVSLFTANGDHPVRVIGYLEKVDKNQSRFVRDPAYETALIEVTDICSYTFAESENNMSDFWVEGQAGWFLLKRPAPSYNETFSMMQECISMFNFMAGKERMLRKKIKRTGSISGGDREQNSYSSSVFTSFLVSRNNFCGRRNVDAVRVGYNSHREFMITSMLEGQGELDWHTSPMLSYFENEYPDLFGEIRARVCDEDYVTKPEAHGEKKIRGEGSKVESKKPEGRNVESKRTEERYLERKKPESRKPESKQTEEKKVESKKVGEKKGESKKTEERNIESKKVEDRKVEVKRPEGRNVETKNVEDKKVEVKNSDRSKVEEEKQAEGTQLALNSKPRMKDPNSKPSRKAKRIIPTRGGLAMYPRYPSADIREEVNARTRAGMNLTAVSFSSEDELTSARDSPKALSELKLNLSKPRTPRTPRKANLSDDELEQPKPSKMARSATNEDVRMLESETPEGDGVKVPRTRTSTLRPTRGTPRGRGASRPRGRPSNEDDKSTMPVMSASRYQTRAAQPIAEPAPYHTYPPRRYLEVSVQRFELPDDRPQGPGNLWACQRPGCGFREHNAVSAEGLARVRSHIQHHADEDAKREPFFENPFRDNPNHPNHIPAWAGLERRFVESPAEYKARTGFTRGVVRRY